MRGGSSALSGASVRCWLEDAQHEWYMVVLFPGTWERRYAHCNVVVDVHDQIA